MHYYFNYLSTSDFSSVARRLITKPLKDRWLRDTYEKTAKDTYTKMMRKISNAELDFVKWDDLSPAEQRLLMRREYWDSNPLMKRFVDLPVNSKEVNKALLFYDRPSKFKQMFYKHGLPQESVSLEDLGRRFTDIPERKQHLRKYQSGEKIGSEKEMTFISGKHPDYIDIRRDPVSWEYLGFPKVNGYIENIIDANDPKLEINFKPRKWY